MRSFDYLRDTKEPPQSAVEDLCSERGYDPAKLHGRWINRGYLRWSDYDGGRWCFPVVPPHQGVVGCHQFGRSPDGEKKVSFFPAGIQTAPLVWGRLDSASTVLVLESQWDAIAVTEVFDSDAPKDIAVIVTRGASNGIGNANARKIQAKARVFGLLQRDEVKAEKVAAEEWFRIVQSEVPRMLRVETPEGFEDPQEWLLRAGIADFREGLRNAMKSAVENGAGDPVPSCDTDVDESSATESDYAPGDPHPADDDPPFADLLSQCAMGGETFFKTRFPPRPYKVGDWFCAGDLGFVFAPRGVGKTWFAHMLISALTRGEDLGPWQVPDASRVCLLDGEMPPDSVQERLSKLSTKGANLTILSHQFLFDISGRGFQLGDAEQRTALLEYCSEKGVEVLVIDNLSSVSNVAENDNDEWTKLGDWLLDFRRKGISVIVVHHAGRNGNMRGASRREDPAFWVIRLDDSKNRTDTAEGARFVSTFTKSRNSRDWPGPLDWHVTEDEGGDFIINHESAGTAELVYQSIKAGVERCCDIAEELGITKGTVSKAARKLESSGRISIGGGGRYAAN